MSVPPAWKLVSRSLSLHRPLVMGVLNVTPDSFSDGGTFLDPDAAVAAGEAMVAAGADIVDVGGESTRPGADPVPEHEEAARVLEVIRRLARAEVVVSVDTAKPAVAAGALEAGAQIVNDVTGVSEPDTARLVAASGAGIVAMHMRGSPRTMQVDPRYDDVVGEVLAHLLDRAAMLEREGVDRASIVIDPGIGFGKTATHNLVLLRQIGRFVATGYPVMVGASRKSFLGALTGIDDPSQRDHATAAVTALMVASGVAIVRVHDVATSRQAAQVAHALSRARPI